MIRWPGICRPRCSASRRVRRALLVCITLAVVGSVPPAAILADGDDGALLTVTTPRSERALVLDPALAGDEAAWTILANTNNGLMAFRRQRGWAGAEVVADLAEAPPRIRDNGTKLIFRLREGVRFTRLPAGSDRDPLILASDVEQSLRRMLVMDSPGARLYENIKGARAFIRSNGRTKLPGVDSDDRARTVTICLEKADPSFLMALAMPYASVLPKQTPAIDQSRAQLPATGPYYIRRYDPNRVIELSRSRGYQSPVLPKGSLEGITVKFVSTEQALQDIVSSDADATLARFAPSTLRPFAGRPGVRTTTSDDATLFYFFMNTQLAPFDDPRVRQAVELAIDRNRIVELYGGQAETTAQAIPPVLPSGQRGPRRRSPSPNAERGEQLVRAAGHRGTRVTVYGYLSPPSNRVTEYLVARLRRIGLNATSRIVAESQYAELLRQPRTKAQIGYGRWRAADGVPDPGQLFARVAGPAIDEPDGMNFSFFDDREINQDIAIANALPLGTKRDQAWAEIDQRLTDPTKLPWVPFARSIRSDLLSDRIQKESVVVHPILGLIWSSLVLR